MRDPSARLFVLVPALVLAMPAALALAGDRAVARVAGEAITQSELEGVLAREPGLTREEAIRAVAQRLLILQWAKKRGLTVAEREVDQAVDSVRARNNIPPEAFEAALAGQGFTLSGFRDEMRDSLLVNRAIGIALQDRVNLSDEEIAERWRRDYPGRTTFTLRHIFFAVPPDAAAGVLREKELQAAALLGQIRSAKLTFQEAARQSSEDAVTRDSGGELGTFQPGELFPEMDKAVQGLEEGKPAGPVVGPDGIHLIEVVSRGTVFPTPLETVKEELGERLREEKGEAARMGWVKELEKEFLIEIFPDGGAIPPAK